jgi:hypothetical protein
VVTWTAAGANVGGCVLIGYESIPRPSSMDAGPPSTDTDAAGRGRDRDASDGAKLDARGGDPGDTGGDASADSAVGSDGAVVGDAGDTGGSDDAGQGLDGGAGDAATDDAGDGGDAGRIVDSGGAACTSPNACGGCSQLSSAVGSACGVCGLGHYVCDGSSAVVCSGGDARPSASGPVLIDDLEDGDRFVNSAAGLSGDWHTVVDDSGGTISPPSGTPIVPVYDGAGGSARSVRVSGHGFTGWGAGVAVTLNAYQCSYDASAESGISFDIKGSGSVIVSVATRQTTPTSAGGTCVGTACNDHFNQTFTLTTTWTHHTVPWTSLHQSGWGKPATFSPSDILYIQFSFAANTNFDVYVDNLSFY